MKKKMVFPVILMILTGLVFAAFFSCDTGGGDKGPIKTTYTGKDTGGKEYTLIVTGYTYELFIDEEPISTGNVSISGNTLTLSPNADGEVFEITVDGNDITKIEGAITPDDGDPITPGEILPPFTLVAGIWDWSLSDDSVINGKSVFAPGGESRITNAKTDESDKDDDGNLIKRPFEYPEGTVKDNDGNTISGTVYNFTGITKVIRDNRPASEGARFPMVGWEAVPDEETLAKLKTAYGYTFWVRLNSSTASNWSFVTAVVTDFAKDEGYEYKHYFGNKPGDSVKNFTKDLKVGTWYKITVIMDKAGFNMDQDNWIHTYNQEYEGPFNQNKAQKIQWQIPLQHNGGVARNGDPYDIITGSYNFNLDFYGFALLMK